MRDKEQKRDKGDKEKDGCNILKIISHDEHIKIFTSMKELIPQNCTFCDS